MTNQSASRAPGGRGIGELRPGLLRGGPSAVAAQILLVGYLIGFAVSIVDAIAALEAGRDGQAASSGDRPSTAMAGYLLLLVLALAAAVITMRSSRRRLGLSAEDLGLRSTSTTRRRAPIATLFYLALLAAAVGLTSAVLGLCGVGDNGVDGGIAKGPAALPVELFHSVVAGLAEEPVLLAVPIALSRRCHWSWPVTLGLMVAMRIAFHVYEGWSCLFVVPWIAGAYVLYRWCPLLWPFVVAHGAFDALQILRTYGGHVTAGVATTVIAVAVFASALVGALGYRRANLSLSRVTCSRPRC